MRSFKEAVIYQIYIKSFYDTDGDGLGDLKGIKEKLPYLYDLGVDYIWITPFYKSPLIDNGYDVEDYRSIDERFGTMEDFEALIEAADKLDIGIMMDMVFNHSSTEHEWFKKALLGDEKYKNYYIIRKGDEEKPPTNWISKFGGSAWEKFPKSHDGKDYYLHLFHKTQGDLNWENEEVRNEIYDIVNFWIKKGVKGFRFDVINLISKPSEYMDSAIDDGRHFYTDGPKIHEYLKELNNMTFGKNSNLVTVGEMSSTSLENSIKYSKEEEKELNMVFSFHHLKVDYYKGNKWSSMPFDFLKLKELISSWQEGMEEGGGWNALFLNNHDQPRSVSRFGSDGEYHEKSAKMLATFIHLLRGTPYIYQGEELGVTNAYFDNLKLYKDIESINYAKILKEEGRSEKEILDILSMKSRDNGRTPMPWNEEMNYGFTKGEPWIDFPLKKQITAKESTGDENSIYNYYKKLINLRHNEKVISLGSYREKFSERKDIMVYERELQGVKITVILNFYGETVPLSGDLAPLKNIIKGKRLIGNYSDLQLDSLRPYEAIVVKHDN